MKILCAGLRDYQSGKTTLTLALLRLFKESGQSVCGFKPKSGNNLWYHWTQVKNALKEGFIYGKDAKLLYNEISNHISINQINPVHRLWMPTMNEMSFGGLPHFILDRITINDRQIVAFNSYVDCPVDHSYFEPLLSRSEQIKILNRTDLQNLTRLYEEADRTAERLLKKKYDILICESYADTGLPWNGISELDYVFTIEPFHLSIYEGERYLQASEVISTLSIEQKTKDIIEPLKPLKKIKIPPFADNIINNYKILVKKEFGKIFDDLSFDK
jgi:predicted P-loop ATPase/GTPase